MHCREPLVDAGAIHFPRRRGEDSASDPMIGTLVGGKYRVTGILGRGGMGTVFRAVHEGSHVPVALKLLHPRLAARPTFRTWFLAEARKAGLVSHEHSARILDVGEGPDGSAYIAMEQVDGTTLAESMRTASPDPLPAATVVTVLRQTARALQAAHAAGVVHRDLSPRNVLVAARDSQPWVKVLDFGIAKGVAAEQVEDEQEPARFSNPPYTAPEVPGRL